MRIFPICPDFEKPFSILSTNKRMYHFIGISSGMIELEELFIGGSFSSKSKPRESTLKNEQAS